MYIQRMGGHYNQGTQKPGDVGANKNFGPLLHVKTIFEILIFKGERFVKFPFFELSEAFEKKGKYVPQNFKCLY